MSCRSEGKTWKLWNYEIYLWRLSYDKKLIFKWLKEFLSDKESLDVKIKIKAIMLMISFDSR